MHFSMTERIKTVYSALAKSIKNAYLKHMGILEKILNKDPLLIRDDDHPERPDISKEEFAQALAEMVVKYNLQKKKTISDRSPFTDGLIEAMNSIKA